MTRQTKPKKKLGGPYLAAAVFCTSSIEDKQDNTISIIRIIDQVIIEIQSAPPDFPSKENRLAVPVHAVLAFRTGGSPGKHTVRLLMESPSGKTQEFSSQELILSPEPHGGFNWRVNGVIHAYQGGLFWLHVFMDGKRIARMPLQVTIRRTDSAPTEKPKSSGGKATKK
jgi:hypothetical protein